MNQLALITGATSGIGEATAKLFAKNGIDLIICGRRIERLDKLASELSKNVTVHILSFDIRDKDEVFTAIETLPDDFQALDILVNNAGNAFGLSTIDQGDISDWDNMMDTNVKGLLYVSKAVIPGMVERNRGHIINIGSIASYQVYPKGNVYCASKYAVDAITQGMRYDLLEYGIKVTAINPGAVNTEFSLVRFNGDKKRADSIYDGFEPLTGHDVAETILFAINRPEHVNIAELTVLPKVQAAVTTFKKEQ